MDLISVDIDYFRCFRHYHADFAKRVTAFIGKNGVGKSSLIHATIKALSFIFCVPKDENIKTLSAGNKSLKVNGYAPTDYWIDWSRREVASTARIEARATVESVPLEWCMRASSSNNALYTSLYINAYKRFIDVVEQSGRLPLLVYFSDSFPHRPVRMAKWVKETIFGPELPRNFGYYQWDHEASCTSIWETRLGSVITRRLSMLAERERVADPYSYQALQVNAGRQASESDHIIGYINEFVKRLISSQTESYTVRTILPIPSGEGYQLRLVFDDGRESTIEQLPSGYRRLLSMVIEIAYRSFILNGHEIAPAGIVIIDEIDLHLHPGLEENVINAFTETFPEIQFIVSTHSPAAISNLNCQPDAEGRQVNAIYALVAGKEAPVLMPNLYGIDYNATIDDYMGASSRNEDLQYWIDKYNIYRQLDMTTEASTVLGKIEAITGPGSAALKELTEKHDI